MKMNLWLVLAVIAVLAIAIGGIYIFTQSRGNYPTTTTTTTGIPTTTTTTETTTTTPTTTTTTTQPQTYNVSIQNVAFSPSTLTIHVGDTVVWTNKDSVIHTVTSDTGTELNSANLSNGETYSHTFNQAGTFNYHCTVHPMMKAKVIVE